MPTSQAHVPTPHGVRYLTQLCKHWGHKFPVELSDGAGRIDFGSASCDLRATGDLLEVEVTAPVEDLVRMEAVVAEHLQRFAFREGELAFAWAPLER